MESYREYKPDRRSLERSFERLFFLDHKAFEDNLGFSMGETNRLVYRPDSQSLADVHPLDTKRGIEALVHADSQTLVVPPPQAGVIDITDLAVMSLPVVAFVIQQKPDIIIGCDRGARLYAIAVHSMWGKLLGPGKRLPTLDTKLHFAHLSKSMSDEYIADVLHSTINESLIAARAARKDMNHKQLRLLFIDDWIVSGGTRRHILKSLDALGVLDKVRAQFAVMCGGMADITGKATTVTVPWHDDPSVIGVDYGIDGHPVQIDSEEALDTRRKLHQATRKVARQTRREGI